MGPVAAFVSKLVPGFAGSTGTLYLLAAAIPSALAAAAIVRRARGRVEEAAVAFVVFVLAFAGLGRLPGEWTSRKAEYLSDRKLTLSESEAQVQQSVGVDPRFLAFLAAHMTKDQSFYMVMGPAITTSGPQSWAQFELLPQLEEYYTPCKARWIVFFDSPPHAALDGVELERPVLTYEPDYSLARNATPCT